MDNRPIGVFDSGLGGLTAMSRLMEVLPGEDIIYFGDTGRVPYGGRSKDTIIKYARQDIAFLMQFDIKAIVVACGTVSTTALDVIEGEYSLPIIGVVQPAVEKAALCTKNGRIGLIGTVASINSGAFNRLLSKAAPEAEIFSKACPLFVPLVENGRYKRGDIVIEQMVREYLAPLKEQVIDTLILGCTHYPLLEPVIEDFMGAGVTLINAGSEAARYVAAALKERNMLSERTQGGTYSFYVSDSPDSFSPLASIFLKHNISGDVKKVNIDSL